MVLRLYRNTKSRANVKPEAKPSSIEARSLPVKAMDPWSSETGFVKE
jgi:hypothetical protein